MDAKVVRPLCEVLGEVADPRAAGGQRYPFGAILTLVCAAMLCGYDNPNQIAIWGQAQSQAFLRELGFPRGEAPKKSLLYDLLARIDVEELEAVLGQWAESVLKELAPATALRGVAIDGKALRGSKKQGASIPHLLSAVSHTTGLTLYQVGVADKTNEIPATQTLLRGLLIEGRVWTTDALLTQRKIAKAIVVGGGDYLMAVKENQERLYQDLALEFRDFSPSDPAPRQDP